MLKNSLILILLLTAFFTARSAEITDDNRVVLAMPENFDKIVTNGDMTVEIIFNKNHKGYIVYHATDTFSPKIHCIVDSARTLHISGSTQKNKVISRVVVLACDSLVNVVNNESGTILIKEIPRVNDFCVISNGSGQIKCDALSAHHLMLSDNGDGSLKVSDARGRFIDIYGNGKGSMEISTMRCHGTRILNNADGTVSIADLKTRRGEIINNAGGEISVAGKAHAFAVVNYASGEINIPQFRCKKMSDANYGTGSINN